MRGTRLLEQIQKDLNTRIKTTSAASDHGTNSIFFQYFIFSRALNSLCKTICFFSLPGVISILVKRTVLGMTWFCVDVWNGTGSGNRFGTGGHILTEGPSLYLAGLGL